VFLGLILEENTMTEKFSGSPKTQWSGNRNMVLLEDFSYTDPDDKEWVAQAGSAINGASIPKALWSSVGAPYVGKYRRASVVHDVAVGEGGAEGVSASERRKADKMFYSACRFDGCSRRFAAVLYIGVSIGTWTSVFSSLFSGSLEKDEEDISDTPEDKMIRMKFDEILGQLEADLDTINFDDLEKAVNAKLPI
jgi:hypothetical protein